MTGRVKWRFRLQWSPGGEEWILPKHDKALLEHPWWKPPSESPPSMPPLEEIPSVDAQSIDNSVFNRVAPEVSQVISARTPLLVASTFESRATTDKDMILPKHDKALLEHPWWFRYYQSPGFQQSIPLLEEIPFLNTQSIENLVFKPVVPEVSQVISARTPLLVASTFESQTTSDKDLILPKYDNALLEYPLWKRPSEFQQSISPLEEIPSLNTQSIDNSVFNRVAPEVSQVISARTPLLVASTFESQATSDKDLTALYLQVEPESTFDTTPRYREARLSNINYKFRHHHFRDFYHSLVPLPLLAPYGRTVLDSSFPRGWLCETCGKMNFQAALRHRLCSSSLCKVRLVFLAD